MKRITKYWSDWRTCMCTCTCMCKTNIRLNVPAPIYIYILHRFENDACANTVSLIKCKLFTQCKHVHMLIHTSFAQRLMDAHWLSDWRLWMCHCINTQVGQRPPPLPWHTHSSPLLHTQTHKHMQRLKEQHPYTKDVTQTCTQTCAHLHTKSHTHTICVL